MQTVRLSSKNQMVLPKESREAMHLKGRDELLVIVKGEVTVIMPKPAQYSSALSGIGKGMYREDYLKKERKAW
ncbi:MAG: AbrB/MazE/SpoVT family DNA-binding domain-containing protein [Nitrospirae bacterium]|nr:MAG: AbrB/MazE/SpoVT family DNA-binding domain-containing protein [Nitrospirota bacterium]